MLKKTDNRTRKKKIIVKQAYTIIHYTLKTNKEMQHPSIFHRLGEIETPAGAAVFLVKKIFPVVIFGTSNNILGDP